MNKVLKELSTRWQAPTPAFFKKVIKFCILASVGAAAVLTAEHYGKMIIPEFSFTLLPWAKVLLKNVFVAGLPCAAIAKLAKLDVPQQPYSAPKDNSLQ